MKFFKFITAPIQRTVKEQALAALSDEEVVKAINEVVRQIILEVLKDAQRGFEDKGNSKNG